MARRSFAGEGRGGTSERQRQEYLIGEVAIQRPAALFVGEQRAGGLLRDGLGGLAARAEAVEAHADVLVVGLEEQRRAWA